MKKNYLIIIIAIFAIIIIAVLAVNLSGLWPFLNGPINHIVAGTPDKSCQIDSDCQIKPTQCGYCGDCGDAINKNWQQYCPFKNHYSTILCETCPPWQVKCIEGQCQKYFKKEVTDFESCAAAGNPIMESYPRKCSADGQTFTEVLKGTGESCSQSADCQLPMDYAVRSNCPYQAFCYNQKCAVGCPLWQEKTNTWEVKCQEDKDCNCAAWNEQTNYACACVDGQCASIVAGSDTNSVVCGQEEKLCPDGFPVYRTGPNCEFADCPLPDLTGNDKYDCQIINGEWLDQYQECMYVSKNWCDKQGGVYNECASACRHDPKAQVCTMQCVPVCQLK